MKTFRGDYEKFLSKVKNNENFSLSRWGDGELTILENKKIDLRFMKNGEFRYDPSMLELQKHRQLLQDAYVYKDSGYYIGIACQCCVGYTKYMYMKQLSGQDEEHLTWANIFVNSNYSLFISTFLPEMKNHKSVIVVNKKSNPNLLPFTPEKVFYVGTDAWVEDIGLIEELKTYIQTNDIKNHVFLVAAGPFANILTHQLWMTNKDNIYIDIGSTLDRFLGLPLTRDYQIGLADINKVCIW